MLKKFKKVIGTTLVLGMMTTTAYAAWHQGNMDIPSKGTKVTTARSASGGTQYTKVANNKYDVYGRIIRDSNNNALSSYLTHYNVNDSRYNTMRTHSTGVGAGTSIRAEFRNDTTVAVAHTIILGWEP